MDGRVAEPFFWEEEINGQLSPCITSVKRKVRSKKWEFLGWGSEPLIGFLQSIGKDTKEKISQFDVSDILTKYVKENNLLDPKRKKKILCDEKLLSLFGRKSISRNKIYDLLEAHYAENHEESDDGILDGSENENEKQKTRKIPKKKKLVKAPKSCFAAIIPDNIKLVYLKRSLVQDLLKDPESLKHKIVGSFIRIKSDPNDYLQKNSHWLLQVTGLKEVSRTDNTSTEILLQASNYLKDIHISTLSDDNFSKEECEDLCQRVKDGLLRRPTVVELEEKARTLHEDITKHWLVGELALLQKLIDRANEKGWRRELFEYLTSLVMLNRRCLGIVFDLDETLIVANTMRSFEDRIDALLRKISTEVDPQRIAGMQAEIKRYQDDKSILKQYADNDQVIENGKVIKVQSEVVPALSDNHPTIVRPLIRLQEKNIILTRINPQIRDTSVLVRLRPAWEDLRSYLTARGRKRFEVYVCTMAERDYALEMWRLLDPESNLINTRELLDRIVCVKSGSRKSLFNVFQGGICHPNMALVIDDRLKVWDEKDQPRVHVVPAFSPYYAPQAEANNSVPVLFVARNVACNVRGGFFKEFDDGLLQRIPELSYEDDLRDIPLPPDVSNYLVSEDDASLLNGNKDPLPFDGMADAEVERRLKDAISASSTISSALTNLDRRLASLQHAMPASSSIPLPTSQVADFPFPDEQFSSAASLVKPLGHVSPQEPSLQSSPVREEGEVPESELDPDTRRRLLILQHGQDTRDQAPSEPSFPVRTPMQVSAPSVQSRGSWFPSKEEMSTRQLNRAGPKEFPLDSEPMQIEKHWPHHPSFSPKVESPVPPDRLHENQRLRKESLHKDNQLRLNHTHSSYNSFSGDEVPLSRSFSSYKDFDFESGRDVSSAETPATVLQDIAIKCGAKVEFRPALVASMELQFSVEAWFAGEKIGQGTGKTRREAQQQAADASIKNLANVYMFRVKPESGSAHGDFIRFSNTNDNGFLSKFNSFGGQLLPKEESVPLSTVSEPSTLLDPRPEVSKLSIGSVSALKELCMMEGRGVAFSKLSPSPVNSIQKDEVYAQVEIDGQVLGKGIGSTWDEAKMQAAEKALGTLRSTFGQFPQKRQGSPRSLQGMSSKHLKPDFPQVLQRMPASGRYPKNSPPVP